MKLFFIDTPLQNIINFYIEVEQYKTVSEHEIEKVGQILFNKYLNTTSPEYLSFIPTERLLQITEQLESGGYVYIIIIFIKHYSLFLFFFSLSINLIYLLLIYFRIH